MLGASPSAVTRLSHSKVTRGVWRVAVAGATAIVKVVVRPQDGTPAAADPTAVLYWLREARLYASGVPRPYVAAGVRGPRMLARFDRADGDIALWIEDVQGIPAAEWDLSGFARAARRLGRAQGAYLAGEPLPTQEWLSRRFMRGYFGLRKPQDDRLLASDEAWRRPGIAPHFPPELRDALRRLRRDRERFLSWIEDAPQTFAHLDVWPDNLFETAEGIVLIDWGFAGIGAAGEDAGNLVPDSVFDLRHPASILDELDRTVFDGYVSGLREAGWDGDERLIRLVMTASACKYDWIAGATLARASQTTSTQPIYGGVDVDADEFFSTRAAVLRLLVGWAAEARGLADALGRT